MAPAHRDDLKNNDQSLKSKFSGNEEQVYPEKVPQWTESQQIVVGTVGGASVGVHRVATAPQTTKKTQQQRQTHCKELQMHQNIVLCVLALSVPDQSPHPPSLSLSLSLSWVENGGGI